MNIAKALKVKNRLAGEISKLQNLIRKENCCRNDNPSRVDVVGEYKKLTDTITQLVDLKTKISVASQPIFDKIINLQEAKNQINFLNSLSTKEGNEKVAYGQNTVIDYQWISAINEEKRNKAIKNLEETINNLQDEIDTFNAQTEV